jgi:hypothetical protein
MDTGEFNEQGTHARYTYRQNPMYERSFQILKWDETCGEHLPFGEYTLLDDSEKFSLSEKKVINLVSALNNRRRLIDLGEEAGSRTLYRVVPGKDEKGRSRVVFYTHDGESASKENAIFIFEGDIDDET